MTSIDERVVSMKFNNRQFLSGVADVLNALANLKKGLNLDATKNSLSDLGKTASKFPPGAMARGIENISAKFLALSTIGVTALANIANRAVDTGIQLVKSLTVDPVQAGLQEYETNLNAIQTILANTGLEGEKGLARVNAKLDELNQYADDTIFNFAEMARNIGTFTAAGVDLDTSTAAIKGIANLAAISGSTSQQASTAMYQLSQALSAGRLTLEDWNSVVNAGLGGKVFRDAITETARVQGVAVDQMIEDAGSFRLSLQEGWITSEILTETLSKFTGDLTKSQLENMGYTEDQIAGIIKMGQTATDAATKVKTMTQLISTLQESAQSGWAQTWAIIFGDFNEAKELFTDVSETLGAIIGASSDARNEMLQDWDDLGGRTVAIEAVSNAFEALIAFLRPLGAAFRDVFPAVTGQRLLEITERIRDFTAQLKIGDGDAKNLRRTAAGLFAIFSIGFEIFKAVFNTVARLFGAFDDGSSSVLEISGNVGDFLVSLDKAIKRGDDLTKFFGKLGDVLVIPIQLLGDLIGLLASGDFGGGGGLDTFLGRVSSRLEPFSALGDTIARVWGGIPDVLGDVWTVMRPFVQAVADLFGALGSTIADAISDGGFDQALDIINTGLLAAIALAIRNFLSGGSLFDFGGDGLLDSIREAFGGLTDTLGAMQASLKSGTLVKIAGAIALLTASVVAISLIDSGKLTKSLTAISVMFVQLGGAMVAFDAVTSTGAILRLGPMAAGLTLLAGALLLLSASVAILSTLSWEELSRGLAGIAGGIVALAGGTKLLSGVKGLPLASVGLIGMAIALGLLSVSVKIFSSFSWEEMLKGLTGVAGALVIIAGAMAIMPATLPITAAGLVGVAIALVILSKALETMAGFTWEEIAKSIVLLAGSLIILAGAMYLMTGALPGALAMLVVAPALILLAEALERMGDLSWEEIGKAMVALTGSLLLLAGGMYLMTAALPGAAALLVVSAALAILAPVLVTLGQMSWEEIGKGLTVLAGALTVIGIAGLLLTPVIPTLLGLGVAILLLGVGTLAAGVGLLAFSAGLTALAVSGAAGAVALTAIAGAIIGLIPAALKAVGEGIVLLAEVIAGSGPTMIRAMTTLMISMLTAIDNVAPKIIDTIFNLIVLLIDAVADAYPKIYDAGLRLILGLLRSLRARMGRIIRVGTDVIIAFIRGIGRSASRITDAGADTVIRFVNSLARTIRRRAPQMRRAGRNLASAIVDGMTGGLFSGSSKIRNAATWAAQRALGAAKWVLGIRSPSKAFMEVGEDSSEGFAIGITNLGKMVERSASDVGKGAITELSRTMRDVGSGLESEMDLTPAITPVLDLSLVRSEAGEVGRLLAVNPLAVGSSTSAAASISVDRARAASIAETENVVDSPSNVTNFNYTQNNTSPESLSPSKIYRQTNNQLSTVKEVLGVNN